MYLLFSLLAMPLIVKDEIKNYYNMESVNDYLFRNTALISNYKN